MKSYIERPENVTGDAQVAGDARVTGNARVAGNAWVTGDAQVTGNARVSGDARVTGNARVSGDARVTGNADLLVVGPTLSSGRYTTATPDAKIKVRVMTGCFSGTVAEFKAAIEATHTNNPAALKQYRLFAALIEANFKELL